MKSQIALFGAALSMASLQPCLAGPCSSQIDAMQGAQSTPNSAPWLRRDLLDKSPWRRQIAISRRQRPLRRPK